MVVFVFVGVHEGVDVLAVPVVFVAWCWRDWFGCPGFPLVAEPCGESWDLPLRHVAVVDGSPVASDGGLEAGELDRVLGDRLDEVPCFAFDLAAFAPVVPG